MYLSVYLSGWLSVCLSIYLSIYLSIEIPLVALIIVCKVKSFPQSSWNPSKILSKSFQNPSKIHQNRFKIGSQIDTGSQTRSKIALNAIFSIFSQTTLVSGSSFQCPWAKKTSLLEIRFSRPPGEGLKNLGCCYYYYCYCCTPPDE